MQLCISFQENRGWCSTKVILVDAFHTSANLKIEVIFCFGDVFAVANRFLMSVKFLALLSLWTEGLTVGCV